jgi:hypothetical protein
VTALKESLEAQHRIAIDAAHEKHAQEVTMLKQGMDEQTNIIRENERMLHNFGGVLVTIAGEIPISQEAQNWIVTADRAIFHASLRKLQDEVKAFVTGSHTDVKEKHAQEVTMLKQGMDEQTNIIREFERDEAKQTREIEELRQEVKNRDEECMRKDVEMLNRSSRQNRTIELHIATIVELRADLVQYHYHHQYHRFLLSFLFSFLHPFLPFRPVLMSLLLSFLPSSLFRPRFSKSPATSFNSKMDQKW